MLLGESSGQMRAHEESWGWGREQHIQHGDPATGSSSRQWQDNSGGQWETSGGQWEASGGNWDQLSSDDANVSEEFESIMQWDDSGALEALQMATERYEADLRGIVYPVSLPSPDLYIQNVDWDTHVSFDLPESADALAAREEKRGQRRRGRRGGRFQGSTRGLGHPVQQDCVESDSWNRINPETVSPSPAAWADSQEHSAQSRWDHPMPDVNGWTNATAQDRPVLSGWGIGQPTSVRPQWQDRTIGHSEWQCNSQTQPTYDGWGGPSIPPGQPPLSGWLYGNDLPEAPGGVQSACSAGRHQTNTSASGHWNSGMGDAHPSGWMPRGQTGGRYIQPQSRAGHWQRGYRGAGNMQRAYIGPPDRNSSRWGQPPQQWHPDGSMNAGT